MRRIAAALVLPAALALTACGAEQGPPTSAGGTAPACSGGAPQIERTIATGDRTGLLAAGPGAVWAADERSGLARRIDARTGRASAPVRVGESVSALEVTPTAVWAADRDGDRVVRIDPESLRVRPVAEIGTPVALSAAGESLWILSLDDGALYWLLIPDLVVVGLDHPIPARAPGALAALNGELWVLGFGDRSVVPFDMDRRRVVRAGVPLGRSVSDIAAGHGDVWVADPAGRQIVRVEARARAVTALPLPIAPSEVAVDGCALWAMDAAGLVVRVPFGETAPAGEALRAGGAGGDLVAVDGRVWASDPAGRAVRLLSAR